MGEEKNKNISAEEEIKAPETEQLNKEKPKNEEPKTKKDKKSKKKKQSSDELLLEAQEELAEIKEKYYRKLAEMENYKKRVDEDMKRERKYAGYSLANRLVDSLVIFNQALNMETNDPNLKNFLHGFKMIDEMIFNAMKDEGVAVIDTKVGDPFDPTKQEAVDIEYDPQKPENTVLKVQKKGFLFKDRILKPSMVVINIKPNENEEETLENKDQNERKDD